MKQQLRDSVETICTGMGELEGFILMAIDDKKQFNNLVGKCGKMVSQLVAENDEAQKLFEYGLKAGKLEKKMGELLAEAKKQGLIPEEVEL